MSRRARIGIIIALIGIGLTAIGIVFLTRIVQQSIAPPALPTPVAPITAQVVVAIRDIGVGEILNAEALRLAEVPVEIVPRNAVLSLDTVIGKFTKVQLVAGEMVLDHHIADPTNVSHDLALVIGTDQVLFALPATDLMSQLNILQRGDLIDILVSLDQPVRIVDERFGRTQAADGQEDETEERLVTFDALQRVTVSAVIFDIVNEDQQRGTITTQPLPNATPQPEPTPRPSDVEVTSYLIALTPQDALVLKNLLDAGGEIDIVLRNPNAVQLFELEPVFSEYLIDRYELELIR